MARRTIDQPPRLGTRAHVKHTTDAEFLRRVTDSYQRDVEADRHNIEPAREDMRFAIGDQWDQNTRQRRELARKPVLTVNRLNAFVAQYVGSQLQSDTVMKLTPTRGGSRVIADVRQGIIRAIMRDREARHAIHTAMTNAYICGVGNFMVTLEDAVEDVFLRDIRVKNLSDPFAVIWDRSSVEPTGADARRCYVTTYMSREDFDAAYPKAAGDSGWMVDEFDTTAMTGYGWDADDMVRVCQFWQMREEPVVLGLEADTNDVIDVSDMDPESMLMALAVGDDGMPMVRKTVRRYAECYVVTAGNVLEGPYRLNIPRLPVFRVEGWALQEASVRYRWGFVRNAKDPQRLHNYWRSVLAEELMKAPSAKWLLDKAGDKVGMSDDFRNAHLSHDPVLMWDSAAGGMKPELIPPLPINQAVLTEASMTVQDMRDVTNRHEVAMGQRSNEVSGRAIAARQRVSEMGDVIYVENLNAALAEAGRVINSLIPEVYDTNRTVKIMGEDDQVQMQEINGIMGDKTPDVTVGKYDVTYTTGPSYATKRQEAVDLTMTLMNTMPQTGNVIADIIVRNMDIPGASEIEERLASLLPPGMLNPDRLSPQRRDAVMQQMQMQQMQQVQHAQLQQAVVDLQMAKLHAEAQEITARAGRQAAQASVAASQVGVDQSRIEIERARILIDAFEKGLGTAKLGFEVEQQMQQSADALAAARAASEAARAASEAAVGKPAGQGPQNGQGVQAPGEGDAAGGVGEGAPPSGEPMLPGLGGLTDQGMPVRPRTAPVEDNLGGM